MTPNLCLCAMKLAKPRTWFQPEVVESVNHLHYQSEPVPGVYLIRRDGRYLVAMKPRGTPQDAKIFKRHITLNEHEAEVYMEEGDISCTSWSIDRDATTWSSMAACTSQIIHSITSSTSEESRSSADVSTPRKVRFVLPAPQPRRGPYHPQYKTYRKSPLRQCQNAAEEGAGDPPTDHRHGRQSVLKRYHEDKCPLRSIDTVGFRYLSHPLQVEYSPYLQRWMFTAELQKRTVIAKICAGAQCTHGTNNSCERNKILKQFTCLDDGLTWLLTGDVTKNGRVKKRKGVARDTSPLYAMMDKDTLRSLNDDELTRRRAYLEFLEGRFLRWMGEPKEYIKAVEYIQTRA